MATLLCFSLMCGMCSGNKIPKVIDLSYQVGKSSITWPTNPDFNFTILARGQFPNYWLEMNSFATVEHFGTHMDAPAHVAKGKWRVHEIPFERLIGPGVIVDVVSKVNVNPDYRLLVSDIEDWESSYGQIPDGAIVIMKSGWGTRYPNKTLVFNTEQPSNTSSFHFPGFHEDTVQWLVSNRNIHMIGVDTPSYDYGQTTTFPAHQIASANNIVALEMLANLDKVPVNGATIFAGVINLYDGSGGPVRVVAMIPADEVSSVSSNNGCIYMVVIQCNIMVVLATKIFT